jgi:hypothetical protein
MDVGLLHDVPFSRRASLALIAAVILRRPAATAAQTTGSCQAARDAVDDHPDFLWWPTSMTGSTAELTLRLLFRIDPDGTARVHGSIQHQADSGVGILVADADAALASCADRNGDGTIGLTRLQFDAREHRTDRHVPIVLSALEGENLGRSGSGIVTVQIGAEVPIAIEVRLRPRHRGRTGGRR